MFRTILADGGIRDLNAQLGEFGLNAWAAPRGVGLPHLPYQRDEVAVEGWVFHRVRAISNARRGESQGDAKRSRFGVGRGPGRVATLARGAEGQPKGVGRRS